jgi:uncharacterized protein YbjQ (UPF0145 family)
MALINSASKSSRLLASRRYTHDTFTDAQESFTNVLDLRSEEIYTQAQYIPSSALPFSGSSQHGSIQQASGSNLMKYWYRHKLTPSNVNTETWFFLNPTGSDDGVGAQLINDNQEVNFISPKYSVSSLANAITEDATPGYGVVLYKSSTYTQTSQTGSLGGGDKISGNDYIFDYKTGVVQFLNSSVDPASNEVVFMTAYQYVGKTLATGLDIAGDISASNMLLTGNLQLGGGSGDTISVTAEYSGSLIPDVDDAFDLGSSGQQWKDLYINGVGYIDSFDAVTSTGTVSGSAVYGTTLGQNTTSGLKTITIESNSTVNQDLTTDADVTFGSLISGSADLFVGAVGGNQVSASGGNLKVSGKVSASSAGFTDVSASTAEFTTATITGGTITGITDITVADGGTGVSTLTDGGILLGSGTDPITAMAVLGDSEMIVGDGSTDPVAESGATLRTSIGVGTGDSPQFTGVTATGTITGSAVYGTTIGQNRTDGVKTITIESNSTVNQDLTTDASPTFDGLTLTGNTLIGTLAANRNLIVHGDITAQNYIVSSSVTHLTQSFSSGSTIFGDSPDDTHRITGSLFIGTGSLQSVEHITGSGVISGSEVYGTTIGQNRSDGLKTITIESNSTINQDVTTDATPTFDGLTSTGTIASSGLISGSGDLWVGDQSNYISGSGGNLKVSGKISASSAGFTDVSASTAEFTSATITGGTITAITDLAVADGGTGQSNLNDLITLSDHTTGNYVQKVTVGTGLGGAVDAAQTVITSLLATDIKIGEDDQTKIDFGTVNEIHFAAGNQYQIKITDGVVQPISDSDVDLGQTGVRWKDAYVDSITVTGDITGSAIYGTTLGQNRVDGLKTITIESNSTINQDVTTDATPTFGGLTLTGDLTVQGDTTTLSTTNLQVGDAFIFAATGSAASNVDGGLIVQSGSAVDSGSAIYHDTQDERWAVGKGVASDGTAVTPTAYVTTTTTANHNPNTDSGSYGSGEMWINTTDEEIWVRTG